MNVKRRMLLLLLGSVLLTGGLLSCVKEYKQLADLQVAGDISATYALPVLSEEITAKDIIEEVRTNEKSEVLIYPNDDYLWGMDAKSGNAIKDDDVVILFQGDSEEVTVDAADKKTLTGTKNQFAVQLFDANEGFDFFYAPHSDIYVDCKDAKTKELVNDGTKLNFSFKEIGVQDKSTKLVNILSDAGTELSNDNDFRYVINEKNAPDIGFALMHDANCISLKASEVKLETASAFEKDGAFSFKTGVRVPLYGYFKTETRHVELATKNLPDPATLQDKYKVRLDTVTIHLIFKNSLPCEFHFSNKAEFMYRGSEVNVADKTIFTSPLLQVPLTGAERFKVGANGRKFWNGKPSDGDFIKVESTYESGEEYTVKEGESTITHLMFRMTMDEYIKARTEANFLLLQYYATTPGLKGNNMEDAKGSPYARFQSTNKLGVHVAADLSVNYDLNDLKKEVQK